VGGGLLFTITAIVVASVVATRNKGGAHPELVKHKVQYGRLELTIIERGALESAHNSDVYCRVKTATVKPPNIKTLIDDGTAVFFDRELDQCKTIYSWDESKGIFVLRKGPMADGAVVVEVADKETGKKHYADLLVDIEDSALQDLLKDRKTSVDKAEETKVQADGAIDTAKTKLENARFALMKYTGLTRDEIMKPEVIASLKADMAKLASNFGRDPVQVATEDLVKFKSGDYLALVKDALGQIENARSDVSQQEDREAWAYRMAKKGYQTASQAQAETLRKESFQLTLNKVSLNLENIVKSQKLKDLNTFISDVEQSARDLELNIKTAAIDKSLWEQEVTHYEDILEEIKKCKIYTPQDGLVVYYVPEQARGGGGSQQSIVAQGEPVREGQKLMQIPDLKHMLVNTKVHEALVLRVHAGQKATIRVDSFGGRTLHGTVDSVANVAAQTDFFAADVKVYITKVSINPEDIEGLDLKPGMSAEVTITIEDALEHVLTVPIQSIVGGSEMEGKRAVVVMTPEGPQKRDVVVGLSNDKIAEIKEGLQEGDEVVENPKAVLGDKIKVRDPAAEKAAAGSEFGGKGGKGKGGSPKGKGKMDASFPKNREGGGN